MGETLVRSCARGDQAEYQGSWHSYQDFVNGREKFPGWERLWSNLVQQEIRRNTRDGSSSKASDEENCTLATKEKKGKNKKASHSIAKGKK